MSSRHISFSLILAPLALAACSNQPPAPPPAPSPAAKVVGAAQDCLPLHQFSQTRIRDDWTIDFMSTAGNKAWRVTLPSRCPGLKSADSFTYETSLSQLCRQDIIYPLIRIGNSVQRGASCGLAPFTPVEMER